MKSILDRSFKYIPSAQTDLKKTFDRVRREQQRGQQPDQQPAQPICLDEQRRKAVGR